MLGTVGEPINPEAWMWYREVIGGNRCPIVDTWWQTETGGVMITPLPEPNKPSYLVELIEDAKSKVLSLIPNKAAPAEVKKED